MSKSQVNSVPKAVAELNRLTAIRWGDRAPTYSFRRKAPAGRHYPHVFYVWRNDPDVSPFLPSDILWARGDRDHVLAKLRSAIRSATSSQ